MESQVSAQIVELYSEYYHYYYYILLILYFKKNCKEITSFCTPFLVKMYLTREHYQVRGMYDLRDTGGIDTIAGCTMLTEYPGIDVPVTQFVCISHTGMRMHRHTRVPVPGYPGTTGEI